jgi:hypothetical protein
MLTYLTIQAADRYLVQLLVAFPFLFWSQRVIVQMLDLLHALASSGPQAYHTSQANHQYNNNNNRLREVQLPALPAEHATMVAAFRYKCTEYLQQATSFAGGQAYGTLQAYTASVDYNFMENGHAGIELAMRCLLSDHGGGINGVGSGGGGSGSGSGSGGGGGGGVGMAGGSGVGNAAIIGSGRVGAEQYAGNRADGTVNGVYPLAQFGMGVALQSQLTAEMNFRVSEHTVSSLAVFGNVLAAEVMEAPTAINRSSGSAAVNQILIQPLLRLVALIIATDARYSEFQTICYRLQSAIGSRACCVEGTIREI